MKRPVTAAQRRLLSPRAAAKGMTVEQYLDWTDAEYEEACQRYQLMSDRDLQRAVIAQYADRHGRRFEVMS